MRTDPCWPDRPDKILVGRSFGRAARDYDGAAALQRQVAQRLLARVEAVHAPAATIVDLGCGTGFCTAQLAKHRVRRVLALDIAPPMLQMARSRLGGKPNAAFLGADAESLPLRDGSVDLIFSNLALQWCRDLTGVFREFARVLKPGGRVLFSTFGPETLWELRAAWACVDDFCHVNQFMEQREIVAAMAVAGLKNGAVDSERMISRYAEVTALMRELKTLGAHNLNGGRPRHLMGKGAWQSMLDAYPAAGGDGVQATFQVLYGLAGK